MIDFDEAFGGYVEAGIWASMCQGTARDAHGDPADCRGEDCDKGLDDLNFDQWDLSAAAARDMEADLKGFIDSCREERPEVFDGIDSGMVGHDFWLTRNGHGAGFWDRGLGAVGAYLTAMSEPFGEAHMYVNSNGELECES